MQTLSMAVLDTEGVRSSVRRVRCVWNEVRLRSRLNEATGDSVCAGVGVSRVMTKVVVMDRSRACR